MAIYETIQPAKVAPDHKKSFDWIGVALSIGVPISVTMLFKLIGQLSEWLSAPWIGG